MAQVLPAERDLRRVIGDGETSRIGEVDGLDATISARPLPLADPAPHVRRALGRLPPAGAHRHVRDLLEPRGDAGGLGARARRRGLDLPELPRVGDRAAARDAGGDRAVVVARPSGRLVEPGRLQRRVDLRADRDARAARRGARVGEEAARRVDRRDRVLRRRRDVRGRVPRGRELRGGHAGAAHPLLQQQPVGDLDAAVRADARGDARRQGRRLRDARRSRRRRRRARRLRGDARGGRACALRRRPDVHRGGDVPCRAARDGGRPEGVHRPRARRGGEAARVRRPLRALPASGSACSTTRPRRRSRTWAAALMREGDRRGRGRSRLPIRRCSSSTRSSIRPRRSAPTSPSCGGFSMAELTHRRGDQRRVPRRARARRRRDGDGRGRRPRRRRVPRDRGAARPLRRRPLRRHAARRGRDPGRRGRALHGRLAARVRDAVRRVLVPVPRPADQPRRPLPLAHRREDGVPARRAHAVRRRRPRARAARRLAGDVLRAHARA